jgi:5'-nucleotidase
MIPAQKIVHTIVSTILKQKKLDKHLLLNVNIPSVPYDEIKGIKICKQAYAKYDESFDERVDPQGKKYFWLTGEFKNFDKAKDTDVWALQGNYVSVVPVQFDLTNYTLKKHLEKTISFK